MKKIHLLFLFALFSCGETGETSSDEAATVKTGKEVYQENCAICHGDNGKLGSGGAKDLSESTLSREMSIAIIRDGKGAMTPFGSLLSPQEINNVAIYIEELRTR